MALRSLNNPIASFIDYLAKTGTDASGPAGPFSGLTATGGVISDYTDGSNVYRAHIFTSSGTFQVDSIGTFGSNVEYLVVAGGGAGGSGNFRLCGGGGAGGLLSNHPDVPASAPTGATRQAAYPVSPGPYTVSIGAGGAGATNGTIVDGSASNFYPTPVSYPSPTYLRAFGGGGGAGNPNPGSNGGNNTSGNPGGSGGGNTEGGPATFAIGGGGSGTTGQGSNGGRTGSGWGGGGGGGAGEAGCQDDNGNIPANPPGAYENGGYGGDGMQVRIAASPIINQPVGTPGTSPGGGYFAGGGGGSYQPSANAPLKGVGGEGGGGYGIIWPGNVNPFGQDGLSNTGGGGGGAAEQTGPGRGGNGGSGIVVVRYQIGQLTATAKATGGAISYYGGKTIHTFTSSGTFATAPNWTPATVEYVVVGGGGAGGSDAGVSNTGGGGGGQFITGSTPIGAHPVSTTIQVGAGGAYRNGPTAANNGTSSYFGTPITAGGGGGGGTGSVAGANGSPGTTGTGSGGGGGVSVPTGTAGGSGTGPGATSGGSGYSPSPFQGGGGGGAGLAGYPGNPSQGANAGNGGYGLRAPATFINPAQTTGAPGPSPGNFYFGGGGGGSTNSSPPSASPLGGGTGGYGGGGNGALGPGGGSAGITNSGGGGGANSANSTTNISGGSGIVLIAYPS